MLIIHFPDTDRTTVQKQTKQEQHYIYIDKMYTAKTNTLITYYKKKPNLLKEKGGYTGPLLRLTFYEAREVDHSTRWLVRKYRE